MAYVAPFCGLRYNPAKVPDLSKVVTPPYDVISPEQQELFHQASPYNVVRLELGRRTPQDSESDNPHTRAATYLSAWKEEAVLVPEETPSLYFYELDYPLGPKERAKRLGFLCLLRLEDFRAGSVRPHERTFQAVKDERLGLMLACDANLSPVFALYADPGRVVDEHLIAGKGPAPIIRFEDDRGQVHTLWRVEDLSAVGQVRDFLRDKPIFIADGHHRYETALAYRSIQRERHPELGPRAPFEYIMVYLANMNQEGLTILPTHRLVRHLGEWDPASFLQNAEEFFEVISFDASDAGQLRWRQGLEGEASARQITVGLACEEAKRLFLLRSKQPATSSFLSSLEIPAVLQALDVVVLDQVILKALMKLSDQFVADEKNIHFSHDLTEALRQVRSGKYEAGFFINPTRIEQVQEVAGAGLIMPHKSTYFYPKVMSGLVIHHPLVSRQEVVW